MTAIVSVEDLRKTYASGHTALDGVSLTIREGEILALLGPNGAGKTTLISVICGLVTPTSGRVSVGGHDVVEGYRAARRLIGLVPQEIALEPFETVYNTVAFSRGLFGKRRDRAYVERVLGQLSLLDKRDAPVMSLSGGMKRRVVIAKALSHEPRVLFLDEPTAGVDVELRREMWDLVRALREDGVTIILTTHYIEEAEAIADRVGVVDRGRLLLIEETAALMKRMGRKTLRIDLHETLTALPARLARPGLALAEDGATLIYEYDTAAEHTGITTLLNDLREAGLTLRDLHTAQSSLEEIFVGLVKGAA